MTRAMIENKRNVRLARQRWDLTATAIQSLRELSQEYRLSVALGDLLYLSGRWYVSHAGLLRIAHRRRCSGIEAACIGEFTDPISSRWAFKATVYKSQTCRGFVGYGDADPSNVSPLVHGAEMRIAETRAVNRALRKAYGIGLCSVEEIGSSCEHKPPSSSVSRKLANGEQGGPKIRDRLFRVIREHQLDPNLVKCYATDFCGVKTLREATRQQVENFVVYLAEWALKDRAALLCQLNSYLPVKGNAA
jgi:hypothetical protein